MAKLTIMGDMIQLKSDLTREEVERVEAFAPEALKLVDNDGNEVFGVSVGNASFSKYGVCFCSTDADGKLFMSMDNPVLDHADQEEERKAVIKYFAPMLSKLEAVEANVAGARAALEDIEQSVESSVVFA